MQYAIIGDIHSSKEDLEKVLAQIEEIAPVAKVIGTGDLFECIVSKKDIPDRKLEVLSEVMLNPEGFTELLTFPTVFGNQEERILFITKSVDPNLTWMEKLPEKMSIDGAEVIHGHQWKWGGNPWSLQEANQSERVTFFGHSHISALSIDGEWQDIRFNTPYDIGQGEVLVNVGAVVGAGEWVLYETNRGSKKSRCVTFLSALRS